MDHAKKNVWDGVGDQAERNAMLQVLLEEMQVYEIMLERLELKIDKSIDVYEQMRQERSVKSEIKSRQSMIRVLALKNTPYTV